MDQPKYNILNIIIPGKAVILLGISVKILILLFATILRCSFMHLWKAFLWENQQLIKKHVNTTTFENLLQTLVLIFLQNTNYVWQ